ncbi:hypothetical protein [Limnoraphis robusta]|uniref:hypothetical protein n=1 Tax=Limnoraphis robusta TaxID=1118279 RepID=UPI002B2069E8|nr:hypothetical protein [Limnoraphis robusta]
MIVSKIYFKKQRLTVQLPVEVIERARNSVYWTPSLTLAGLVEEALENWINQLETVHGEPFPQRLGELKTGRPIKL